MNKQDLSLMKIYEGWDGHQTSLVHAIAPLTPEQLLWRPGEGHNSIGELARHISLGRINWFMRMDAPGSAELAELIDVWEEDKDGNRHIVESSVTITEEAEGLVHWLQLTWQMIDKTLKSWTVDDLAVTYRHRWMGAVYAVSRQWTIWRILSHDIHHGGQIALMLGMQGIEAFELSGLFGHITLPLLAEAAEENNE